MILCDSPAAITVEWMQAALTAGGKFDAPRIEAIKVEALDAATNALGRLARCRLSVGDDSFPLPGTVIVKLPVDDPKVMKFAKWVLLHKREYDYYRHLAGDSPMRSPVLYYGAFDARSHRFVLVLEDLHPMEVIPQRVGVDGERLHRAIRGIARMHGHFWNAVDAPHLKYLYRNLNPKCARLVQTVYLLGVPTVIRLFDDLYSPGMRKFTEALGTRILAHHADLSTGPMTLVHGDYRSENMFFDSEAEDGFAVIDWQVSGSGCGLYDVSYFMSTSVSIDTRRRVEREVLEEYHDIVCRLGVKNYTFEDCWRSYRQNMLSSYMTCVLGCGSFDVSSDPRRFEASAAVLSRAIAAIEDLECEEFLPDRERMLAPGYTFSTLSRWGYGVYRLLRRTGRKQGP